MNRRTFLAGEYARLLAEEVRRLNRAAALLGIGMAPDELARVVECWGDREWGRVVHSAGYAILEHDFGDFPNAMPGPAARAAAVCLIREDR